MTSDGPLIGVRVPSARSDTEGTAALFADRATAGSLLAKRVVGYLDGREPPWRVPLVLALARAGVPVAAEIARRVGGELGLTVTGVNGRVVVVVPDGLPSASATLDALRSVRQQEPELLVLATPVCPDVAMDLIAAVADETICVYRAEDVPSGRWYAKDTRISDDDIRSLLRRPPPRPGTYHARVLRWARQAASS